MQWIGVLRGARFCLLRPRVAMRVGGLADRQAGDREGLVLGVESWVLALGPWRDSAIDHELTHCRQEYERGFIQQSWSEVIRKRDYLKLWLAAEGETVIVAPLWPLTVVVVAAVPIVAICVQWALHHVLGK